MHMYKYLKAIKTKGNTAQGDIARLSHIGHGFLKFSLILLNSERKICNNVR